MPDSASLWVGVNDQIQSVAKCPIISKSKAVSNTVSASVLEEMSPKTWSSPSLELVISNSWKPKSAPGCCRRKGRTR